MEPGLSKLQILVYAALGVVLLLLGVKALQGEATPGDAGEAGNEGGAGVRIASEPVGSGGSAASGDLVVHVAGAVREPGVYRLPAGSRVAQAIERAGGARPGAEPNAINLAAQLADGQQVVVPGRAATSAAGGLAAEDGPISLGSASALELEQIDGIGPITAEKIIAFRDEQGGLGSIEELDQVPGIGPATLESLADRLQP